MDKDETVSVEDDLLLTWQQLLPRKSINSEKCQFFAEKDEVVRKNEKFVMTTQTIQRMSVTTLRKL